MRLYTVRLSLYDAIKSTETSAPHISSQSGYTVTCSSSVRVYYVATVVPTSQRSRGHSFFGRETLLHRDKSQRSVVSDGSPCCPLWLNSSGSPSRVPIAVPRLFDFHCISSVAHRKTSRTTCDDGGAPLVHVAVSRRSSCPVKLQRPHVQWPAPNRSAHIVCRRRTYRQVDFL